jgi:hypothetical protein
MPCDAKLGAGCSRATRQLVIRQVNHEESVKETLGDFDHLRWLGGLGTRIHSEWTKRARGREYVVGTSGGAGRVRMG